MFLYLIFNKVNCKLYVGITNNINKRWKKHQSDAKSNNRSRKYSIHYALTKYGINNFIIKQIEQLPDLVSAQNREKEWISFLRKNGYKLYNQSLGGEGNSGIKWSDDRKKIASIKNSGSNNPMYGIKLIGAANGNFNKKMKDHVKNKLLESRRKLTDEQILEIKKLYLSKQHSQSKLAKQFNVSNTQIHRIIHGKSWGSKYHDQIITKKQLSYEDVDQIKLLYSNSFYTQKELAIIFNRSTSHINKILGNKKWKNHISSSHGYLSSSSSDDSRLQDSQSSQSSQSSESSQSSQSSESSE